MHIKEKVTGLWARRPRLSGTQGRALKDVAQFFAAMLVVTVAACAKKPEPAYVEQPVSQEPVFQGKYGS